MLPLVSVIIPAYNGERYLSSAIDSLLVQDYANIEIIIVDDGSTDNTKEIVQVYGDKIKYFYKPNGGEASARNYGIRKAAGDFIAFLDCDDLYKKDKISKQLKTLLAHPDCGFVYNDIEVIDAGGNPVNILRSEREFEWREDFLAYVLYRQVIPATAAMMIRKSMLDDTMVYPERYSNSVDYLFCIRMLTKINCIYIKEVLYSYRRHGGNLTNSHKKQKTCEKAIIKDLGFEFIDQAVANSTFPENDKILLQSQIYYKIDELNKAYDFLCSFNGRANFAYCFHKGVCEYALGMIEEARRSFADAIDIDPQRAEAFNDLGCCLRRLGKAEEAWRCFEKAVNLNGDYLDGLNNLREPSIDHFTERALRKTLTKY